jgi:hypothetical protein
MAQAVILAAALSPLSVAADEAADQRNDAAGGAFPEQPVNCLSLARLRETDILDDQTVLFYMRGQDVYVNRLPRRCPGLKSAGAFSYRTSLTELCNTDVITVIRTFGSTLSPGPSCGLGLFQPITREAIAALKEDPPEPEPEAVAPEIQPPAED